MRIYVKENREIPEGYTYTRCDKYSAEELIAACSHTDEFSFCPRKDHRNPHAVAYVKEHRKKVYTTEDVIEIMRRTASPKRMFF